MGGGGGGGGWLEQVRLKLTQSPTKAGVEVGTELSKKSFFFCIGGLWAKKMVKKIGPEVRWGKNWDPLNYLQ